MKVIRGARYYMLLSLFRNAETFLAYAELALPVSCRRFEVNDMSPNLVIS